jgi:hypothetical protein
VDAVVALDRAISLVGFLQLLRRHADEPVMDIHECRHQRTSVYRPGPVARPLMSEVRGERTARHRSTDRQTPSELTDARVAATQAFASPISASN